MRTVPTIRRCSRRPRARLRRRPRACISRRAGGRLAARGIGLNTVTLHVGAGTFLPVKADDTAVTRCSRIRHRCQETAERPQCGAPRRQANRCGRLDLAAPAEIAAAEDGTIGPFAGETRSSSRRLPLQRERPDADQFPSAAIDFVHAGGGLRRAANHARRLHARDKRTSFIASTPTAMHACCSAE